MKIFTRPSRLTARVAAWIGSLRAVRDPQADLQAELEAQSIELEQLLEEVTAQRDLLEQREAELLAEREERLVAFRAVGQLVRAGRDVGELTRVLAEAATKLMRARGACVVLRRQAGRDMEVVGAGGVAVELLGTRFPPEGSISALAIRAGEPRMVSGAAAAPVFAEFIARESVEWILVTPIAGQSAGSVGAFLVMDPRDPSADTVETLSALADQAGAGLAALRAAAEAERRGVQARLLMAAMSRVRAAVLIADAKGMVRYASRTAAALYGYARARDLLGTRLEELYAPELSAEARREIRSAAEHTGWSGEVLQQRRDGTLVPVHLSKVAVRRPGGDVLGTVLIARDVTREKRAQGQLMESDRLALVGGLVSGVAHELNNPLGAIGNFAELLLGGELDDESREMVETIAREALRAGEIVRNLLSFARRAQGTRERVALGEVVSRTLALRAYDQRRQRIEVALDLPADLPAVWADANQIQQVLLNLVVNAEQAIGSDGRIAIRGREVGDAVELAVEDTGPGISADALPHLFSPFFTTKPPGTGTGLGLAISQRIVEAHDGVIEASNGNGGGARFTVRLPRYRPD